MAYYEQPYGQYRKVTGEVPFELGIYYCYITPNTTNDHNFGFFPLKKNNKILYRNGDVNISYYAWYTSVDIAIGREEGHCIEVVPFNGKYVGYSWKHKGLIFKEYIENVLYKLKLEYEKTGEVEHRQIIKLVLNSLWGKFAQKWMNTQYSIKYEGDPILASENKECYKIWDTNWFLIKDYNIEKEVSDKPVQNGVFVLSWARYHMYQLWKKTVKAGTVCLYSDTDSIMVPSESLVKNAIFKLNGKPIPVIGDQMGQLEIEATFHEFIAVGKKQYIGKYDNNPTNPKYKKRFKGVPQEYIVPDMYSHLLLSNEHTVQIDFLKFKRDWGCVHGYIESKTVQQT
jgi:hypothetical protein